MKPSGYWQDPENVKKEVDSFNLATTRANRAMTDDQFVLKTSRQYSAW
jgi:hypothetical protein